MLFLKILGGFVALIAILLLFLYINGTTHKKYEGTEDWLSSWMSSIDDNKLLKDVIVPGSHDAGTKGMIWAGQTQVCTIKEQLESGIRYLDLRVNKVEDKYVMFHSVMNGMEFSLVLGEIRDFITNNPSEVLLLDFQHFKNGSEEKVTEMLLKELDKNGLIIHNETELSNLEFARKIKISDARGKCIIFWGNRTEDSCSWKFLRNDDECTFDDMCLDSYYISNLHAKRAKEFFEKAHPIYFERLKNNKEAGKDAFFVLQCMLRDPVLICGPWTTERKDSAVISDYVKGLKSRDLEGVSVIMIDFITAAKCKDIIALNG